MKEIKRKLFLKDWCRDCKHKFLEVENCRDCLYLLLRETATKKPPYFEKKVAELVKE